MEEEKKSSSVTSNKEEEIIESDENGALYRQKNEHDELQSVQKYAKRIKSFLGWEPEEKSSEEDNKQTFKDVDGVSLLSGSCDDGVNVGETVSSSEDGNNLSCADCLSSCKQEEASENGQKANKRSRSDSKMNVIPSLNENNSQRELIVQSNTDDHMSIQDNDRDLKNDLSDNHNVATDPEPTFIESGAKFTETVVEEHGNSNNALNLACDSKNESNTKILESTDLKMNDFHPSDDNIDKSINSRQTSCYNSNKSVSSDTSQNVNNFAENQIFDQQLTPLDDRKEAKLEKIQESKDSEPTNEPRIEESCKINFEIDKSNNIPEGLNNNQNSDNSMDLGIDVPKGNDESENSDPQEVGIDSSKRIADDVKDNKMENNSETGDDMKSEDSFYIEEKNSLNNETEKPFFKEIRRFSREIVKGIVESARNSVHEMYASTSANENIKELLTGLDNSCLSKENLDLFYDNVIKNSNSESKAYEFKSSAEQLKYSVKTPNNCSELSHTDACKEETIKDTDDESYVTDNDTMCGYGCFKPKWIQRFAKPKPYLILFSIIGIIHGCYYSYVVTVMSTLEKRYAFKSKISGTILMADEITPLILGILVGHIGGKTHRPRMVALGMFMSAACCFVSGIPYLIYGSSNRLSSSNYNNKTGPDICTKNVGSALCDSSDAPPTVTVVGILYVASFLKGFATLSYYVIGMSYMDDIIKKKNSPMYFAIAFALRLLGPLVGFLMSSGFLKLYENPADDPGFGPDDPRWIGAWWIGFFLQGVLLVIFTLPIALFPRRLPGQKKIVEKGGAATGEDGLKKIFHGLTAALKRLGTNPVFIVLILNTTATIFGHFGHAISLTKYMENQFRLSASEASLFSGATTITCIMIATLVGGFLIWRFKPKIKVLLAGMIICEIILCLGYLVLMIPRCETADMLHFGMNEEGLILNNACNTNCECSTTSFTPFCGSDGKTTYFSPCYAGCTQEITSSISAGKNKEFGNCSCVDQQNNGVATIKESFCPDENCWSQALAYLIILFFLVTLSNIFTVGQTMILLRSVHPSDKSFALGTFETFICLLGFIPFPVTFGALVDSACLVWEKSCGETGNCWFYDIEKYNYLLHGTASLFCALSVLCLIILYYLSPRVRDLYDEEDEETPENVANVMLNTMTGTDTKL